MIKRNDVLKLTLRRHRRDMTWKEMDWPTVIEYHIDYLWTVTVLEDYTSITRLNFKSLHYSAVLHNFLSVLQQPFCGLLDGFTISHPCCDMADGSSKGCLVSLKRITFRLLFFLHFSASRYRIDVWDQGFLIDDLRKRISKNIFLLSLITNARKKKRKKQKKSWPILSKDSS